MNRIVATLAFLAVSSASIGAVTLNDQTRRRGEYGYLIRTPNNQVLINNSEIDENVATTEHHDAFVTGGANAFGVNVGSRGVWNTSFIPESPGFGQEITSMNFEGEAFARLSPPTSSNTGQTNGVGLSIYTITVDRDTAARFTGNVSVVTQGDGDVGGFFIFNIVKTAGAGPNTVANIFRAESGAYSFDETFTLQAGATYRVQVQALASILGPGSVDTRRVVTLDGGRIDFSPLSLPGDADNDGVVDFADLNTVLSGFGQSGEALPGDLDQDGAVGFSDLNEVLSNFGAVDD
jgi:hypothetical protein